MFYRYRKRPSKGVLYVRDKNTTVFLTVCTRQRQRWLACEQAHTLLKLVWKQYCDWRVGEYVLLPDHLHLFAYPGDGKLLFDDWVHIWKAQFSRRKGHQSWRWQSGSFHHRIRCWESAEDKFKYMKENPVRLGLVTNASEWPYRGRLFDTDVIW
jgi:putative transposase